jgi:hypothetical protein
MRFVIYLKTTILHHSVMHVSMCFKFGYQIEGRLSTTLKVLLSGLINYDLLQILWLKAKRVNDGFKMNENVSK